jgi:hypothetical protein
MERQSIEGALFRRVFLRRNDVLQPVCGLLSRGSHMGKAKAGLCTDRCFHSHGRKKVASCLRIIPGDWGKVGPGWLVRPLLDRRCKARRLGGRIHQFLWRRSRAVSNAKTGTARRGAMRSRSEPGQVAEAGFERRRIAVTQRVIGCYCAPARAQAVPTTG